MTADPYAASLEVRSPWAHPAGRPWAEGTAGIFVGLLGLAAAVIWWRRAAGALEKPLGAMGLLIVAGLAVAAASTARRVWQPTGQLPARAGRWRWGAGAAVSALLLVLAAGLSLPGTSLLGLTILWGVLGGEELWTWGRLARPRRIRPGTCESRDDPAPPNPPAEATGLMADPSGQTPDEGVLQHFVRTRSPDGIERFSGWLRVAWTPGQRTTSAHMAFCPPFPRTPELTVTQYDGPEAKLKVVQRLPYGVRIDLKLNAVAEADASTLLHITGQALSGSDDRKR